MLSSSRLKIHEPPVTGVSPRALRASDSARKLRNTRGQAAPSRPLPHHTSTEIRKIQRRDHLGGLIHEYQQVA
jgi:hypothetical protein